MSRHQSMHSTLFPCPFKVLRVFMTNWPRASIFSATWCTAVRKTNLHEPHDYLKQNLKLNQNWKHISASGRYNMIDDQLYYIWTDIWLTNCQFFFFFQSYNTIKFTTVTVISKQYHPPFQQWYCTMIAYVAAWLNYIVAFLLLVGNPCCISAS